jgi:hypothetical protein
MRAPPQWIFTHTVRFVGIVRIIIQDGEGFILIKKGKPLAYYFKHGRIELKGNAALDYFNSHPMIEFNLCKYTSEELAIALKVCNIEERPAPVPEPAPASEPVRVPDREPVPEAVKEPITGTASPPQARPQPAPYPTQPPVFAPQPPQATATEVPPPAAAGVKPKAPAITPTPVLGEDDVKLIGQIKKLNGIVAVSVFDEERNVLLMGDVEIENLLRIARTMLTTEAKITPLLEWGAFVHMTLQIPEGNVIIAPYRTYHLCLLTTRTINIGHIRRILREVQQRDAKQA